jgi:hypothetical protein
VDEFDFWLGIWRGLWDGGEGTNTITKVLNGRVILEQFRTDAFEGMSVSVYDPDARIWRQTWVDSEGNYLDFVGRRRDDGAMDLRRETDDGVYRMLWHEIEPDRFSWRWERSTDGGASWQPRWLIAYERRS